MGVKSRAGSSPAPRTILFRLIPTVSDSTTGGLIAPRQSRSSCRHSQSNLYRSSMSSTYSVTEAQSRLSGLIKKAEQGEAVRIRRRDRTVALLISQERMEAIVETMEILANPDAARAIASHRSGRTKFSKLSALDD